MGDEKKEDRNTQIINFAEAVTLMRRAISKYLAGQGPTNDRHGLWHGSAGKKRARKLEKYLTEIPADAEHQVALVSLFLSVFGEPTFFAQLGRSSKLASMIADEWITGNNTVYFGLLNGVPNTSNLSSTVFFGQLFLEVLANRSNKDFKSITVRAGTIKFNATKGVRDFLQRFINKLNPAEQLTIKKLAKQFKKILENSSEEINMSIIPNPAAIEKAFVEGALKGAFLGYPEEKKPRSKPASTLDVAGIPLDAVKNVAGFLTELEAKKSLLLVNEAARPLALLSKNTKITEQKFRQTKEQKFGAFAPAVQYKPTSEESAASSATFYSSSSSSSSTAMTPLTEPAIATLSSSSTISYFRKLPSTKSLMDIPKIELAEAWQEILKTS